MKLEVFSYFDLWCVRKEGDKNINMTVTLADRSWAWVAGWRMTEKLK